MQKNNETETYPYAEISLSKTKLRDSVTVAIRDTATIREPMNAVRAARTNGVPIVNGECELAGY